MSSRQTCGGSAQQWPPFADIRNECRRFERGYTQAFRGGAGEHDGVAAGGAGNGRHFPAVCNSYRLCSPAQRDRSERVARSLSPAVHRPALCAGDAQHLPDVADRHRGLLAAGLSPRLRDGAPQ